MRNQQASWRLAPLGAKRHRFPDLHETGSSEQENDWQNYQQAFEEGYQEGERQGREQGVATGLEEGRSAGYQDGLKSGQQEGIAQGRQSIDGQFNEIIAPLAALKSLLEEGYSEQIRGQQDFILDLVRRVSQQVIRCELALQPQQVLKLVEETLNALPDDRADVKIHLEPSTVVKLKELGEDKIRGWKLISDADITAGSCRIVSDKSDADASVETRLNACMEQVEAKLSQVTPDVTEKAGAEQAPKEEASVTNKEPQSSVPEMLSSEAEN